MLKFHSNSIQYTHQTFSCSLSRHISSFTSLKTFKHIFIPLPLYNRFYSNSNNFWAGEHKKKCRISHYVNPCIEVKYVASNQGKKRITKGIK